MSIPTLIIPVLNRYELLDECIASIDYEVDDLLVIDNGGSYSLDKDLYHGKTHVLNMPSNLGVAGSWNLGIKLFPHAKYWVIGSNDTFWSAGALKVMHDESNENSLVFSSGGWNSFSIGSEIIKSVGLFDENCYPAYYEDVDYESRMKLLGLSSRIVRSDAPTTSFGAATTLHSNPEFEKRNMYTNESNYQYWQNKANNKDTNSGFYDLQRRIDNDWLI